MNDALDALEFFVLTLRCLARAAVQHERRVAGHLHTNGHVGNGHAANGQNGNGLSDAATHASHHDHNHEPRPEIIPPAA